MLNIVLSLNLVISLRLLLSTLHFVSVGICIYDVCAHNDLTTCLAIRRLVAVKK